MARRDAQRWFLGLSIIVASSWGRWIATSSLKIDEHYPSEVAGSLLLTALIVGWGFLVTGWIGLLRRPPEEPRRLVFAGFALAAFMLPMLSNDVYSVLAYGSLAAHGRDVYTTASALPESVWGPWIGERWAATVCVYGPATLLAAMPAALAGGNAWLAIVVLKIAWLVPLALVMELSFRALRDRPYFHAMLWLNPLWLLEGPGQLHADLVGITMLVAGTVLQMRGSTRRAWVAYALAVIGKYTFAFAGLWFWLRGSMPGRERMRRAAILGGIVSALAVSLYAPFWHGLATLTTPLGELARMNPGGSITEVVGDLVLLAQGGSLPSPETPVQTAMELAQSASAETWFAISFVLRLVTLIVAARALWTMLRARTNLDIMALGTGTVVVAVATLASHRFEPWYLLPALPFFGLARSEAWERWWIAVVAVCVAPTFIHVLPRTAWLLEPWGAASTGATVLVFVFAFRRRYWDEPMLSPLDAEVLTPLEVPVLTPLDVPDAAQ